MTRKEIERPQAGENPANKTKSAIVGRGYGNENRGGAKKPK